MKDKKDKDMNTLNGLTFRRLKQIEDRAEHCLSLLDENTKDVSDAEQESSGYTEVTERNEEREVSNEEDGICHRLYL